MFLYKDQGETGTTFEKLLGTQIVGSYLFALRDDGINFPHDFLSGFSLARTTSLEE
jgi:hypothetical protein